MLVVCGVWCGVVLCVCVCCVCVWCAWGEIERVCVCTRWCVVVCERVCV